MKIKVRGHFDSAHLIPHHPTCGKIHGHRWEVEVVFEDEVKGGMVLDFKEAKNILKKILDELDHKLLVQSLLPIPEDLADQLVLTKEPTAENLAQLIFTRLRKRLPTVEVTVWESPDCGATYSEVSK